MPVHLAGRPADDLAGKWLTSDVVRVLDVVLPSEDELVEELKQVRRAGISQVSRAAMPALERLARASGQVDVDAAVGAYVIESTIREAVSGIGGDLSDLAAISLGLEPGARADRPAELRKLAAETAGVSASHYRHTLEPRIFTAIAQVMLRDAHLYRMRLTRLRDEARTPVGSRLAVEWLARFESMYDIWTPTVALGNDLTAYRSTLLEEDRPWDLEPDPADPTDLGHTQERQALGYAYHALHHLACLLAATQRFQRRFGGLWLLPDAQAETDLADANYRIRLESPFSEHDESQIRMILAECDNEELDPFLARLELTELGREHRNVWERWCASCDCTWDPGATAGRDYFPTHRNIEGVDKHCDVHNLILGCNDFCLILNDAWDEIADWYRDFPRPVRTGLSAEVLYSERESALPRWMSASASWSLNDGA